VSRRPRIAVFLHAETENLGSLGPLLGAEADLEFLEGFGDVEPFRRSVDRLLTGGLPDALVSMGGPQSVYDHAQHEHLGDSLRLVRGALRAELPLLGICLGAHIIAWCLGAQVRAGRTMGRRKEIGWFPLELTERGKVDPLFHGFRSGEPVFHWHGDTFDLPEGSWHLARSPFYSNQAFRWGRWVYGLQFHAEVTPDLVAEWVRTARDELVPLDYVDGEVLVEQAPHHEERLAALSRSIADHFLVCVRESMAEKEEAGAA
jgi:GMP synthase (glutamine-hydrolysing)